MLPCGSRAATTRSASKMLLFLLLLAPALSQAQLTDPFDTSLCPWDDFMPRVRRSTALRFFLPQG